MGIFEQNPLAFFAFVAVVAATFGYLGGAARERIVAAVRRRQS